LGSGVNVAVDVGGGVDVAVEVGAMASFTVAAVISGVADSADAAIGGGARKGTEILAGPPDTEYPSEFT
jgi:hypothetical protein